MSLAVPGYSIQWMTCWTPSCNICDWLDTMHFRIGLKVDTTPPYKPKDFRVDLWTNLYHKLNNEGEWHDVHMSYLGVKQVSDDQVVIYLFGTDLILTGLGVYSFTFRAKHKFEVNYKWAEQPKYDGRVKVKLPVKEFTVWVQESMSAKITHNIYIGNFTAAMHSPEEGYDCLLNMADDAHVFPQQFTHPIIFKKFPVPFGVYNVISRQIVQEAVAWLRFMSDRCDKVMVCSRTGHARSGSILIAFIYFMNPDLNFDDAQAFVNKRSMVFPHKGLKDILMDLYPRS